MRKKNLKAKTTPKRPAKPATATDVALRTFIEDLIERSQIPVLKNFAQELGYKDSQTLNSFLKGERNYPRPKIDTTIAHLKQKYHANEEFLRTGHGKLYAGKPYVLEDLNQEQPDGGNFLSIRRMKIVNQLEEQNKELLQRIEEMKRIIEDKEEIIRLQREKLQGKREKDSNNSR